VGIGFTGDEGWAILSLSGDCDHHNTKHGDGYRWRYGVTSHDLWFICSLIFFLLILAMSILSLRKPEYRELVINQARNNPLMAIFFWLLLETPIQISLILTLLGLYPNLEPAFYTTALLFHLFEAAFVLAQIVHSQMSTSTKLDDQEESHVLVH